MGVRSAQALRQCCEWSADVCVLRVFAEQGRRLSGGCADGMVPKNAVSARMVVVKDSLLCDGDVLESKRSCDRDVVKDQLTSDRNVLYCAGVASSPISCDRCTGPIGVQCAEAGNSVLCNLDCVEEPSEGDMGLKPGSVRHEGYEPPHCNFCVMNHSLTCEVARERLGSGAGEHPTDQRVENSSCDAQRARCSEFEDASDAKQGRTCVKDGDSLCNWRRRRRGVVWWLLLILLGAAPLASGQLRPNTDITTSRAEGVCQSVDIRNSVAAFRRLSGCRVVEGFVQIVLIDHATESSFSNLTFPELREITHYLLLYRVNGLRSLGKLFPNLTVIRGEMLFLNYALVVFEMIHLQELGLYSLTDILRGGVRIEKNPLLCFVDTVNWDLIAKAGHPSIAGNRVQNECPMCPHEKLQCHNSSIKGSLCWNFQKCQKVCPDSCGNSTCMSDGRCCHEFCLGGCTGPAPEDCVACRDVVFEKRCLKQCPAQTYKYLNRRCIREDECRNMSRPRERNYELRLKPYKPFNNSCILECPAGYVETEVAPNKYSCIRCSGPCRKECQGVSVDSIAAAQKMRGCTYIKGSLEIQIRGGKNVVKELDENLSMVEEIEGYLKIVRSFPLISLNFLRKLRVIHGKTLDSGKYSFVLLDNQNLQELWDWNTRPEDLRIVNGRLFFHFNPKLCLYKIEKLKQVAQLPDFTDLEVAANSNGDKVACNVTVLRARVTKLDYYAVLIEWDQFEHYDPRTLLGYVVYYIEAPFRNLTLYDGRDACGGDGWHVQDMAVNVTITILTHLKPYTQYAFYVKTYTIATERSGAQSPIQYFRTLPASPSPPMALDVSTSTSTELTIKWQPPQEPNGNVTHYVVIGTWIKDDESMLDQRNYCSEPLIPDKKPTLPTTVDGAEKKEADQCVCEDDKSSKETKLKEREVAAQIHFEDSLHNLLYIKRPSQSRRKRDLEAMWQDTTLGVRSMVSPQLVEPAEFGDPDYQTTPHRYPDTTEENMDMRSPEPAAPPAQPEYNFKHIVYGKTEIVVQNLSHYTQFSISVEACREIVPEEPSNTTSNCSRKSFKTGRTLSLIGADNVDSLKLMVEVLNETLGTVRLRWEEPPSPNGIIVTYQIEYKSIENPNYSPMVECITRSQFLNNGSSYKLQKLPPGNYSLRVRAMSLAGYGEYTELRYFYIKHPSSSSLEFVIAAVSGIAVVMGMLFVVVMYLRRRYMPGIPNVKLIATVNPEYVSTVYEPDEWEVPRKNVELLRELGQGSFGMVYEGIVRDVVEGRPEMPCAIKTVNEHATDRERSEFLNEASVMKAFNTHHVVRLLGVVSQGQPVLVVMELMAHGDLKTYLRSHRPDVCEDPSKQPPTLKRIMQMAVEIADGMAYLAGKKFVHRDLAARNCMVAEDLTVKIGDFGMTRDIYETDYYRKGTKGLLPVRWMAPESLKDGVFTSHSDVWSYGVVLWEMATLASQPYQGLSNDQVLRYVIEGGVMERPENCPDRLYQLMRLCWQHKPMTRPSFMELVKLLLPDVSPDFVKVSFYHSEEGRELYAPQRSELMDDPSTPLRVTRDIEDFSLDGGSDDERPEIDVEACLQPHYHVMSVPVTRVSCRNPPNSKIGNGSAATSPTAANGWVVARQSNGTSSANSTGSADMKTTQC
ncbi:Insulin-like receptor [Cryptotermes secundus]|uniref:Tyrosine-protein kinase receptor n=2 Tax=Cryptotermes secundus TaxID=105785 RepID=A0A2J7R3R6_9NEOP|nr:insulin-like receptor isoform X1 [Cryptotermes secundus]XP_023705698.1 insulin-like receptor isoform X1 [Cryptotermes secundus]PNF35477.1 Insulin-like receptor [Cryptotermes secundus]